MHISFPMTGANYHFHFLTWHAQQEVGPSQRHIHYIVEFTQIIWELIQNLKYLAFGTENKVNERKDVQSSK